MFKFYLTAIAIFAISIFSGNTLSSSETDTQNRWFSPVFDSTLNYYMIEDDLSKFRSFLLNDEKRRLENKDAVATTLISFYLGSKGYLVESPKYWTGLERHDYDQYGAIHRHLQFFKVLLNPELEFKKPTKISYAKGTLPSTYSDPEDQKELEEKWNEVDAVTKKLYNSYHLKDLPDNLLNKFIEKMENFLSTAKEILDKEVELMKNDS